MKSYSVVLLLATLCCFADTSRLLRPAFNPNSPNGRIVGGEKATIEEYPWQTSLQVYGYAFCGASIISKDWVVTAAHYATNPASSLTVKAGSALKYEGGSTHQVAHIIKHENYGTNKYEIPENDIALIRVSTPFELDATRQPVDLFNYEEKAEDGILSIITGWGDLYEGGGSIDVLQKVSVPIVSKSTCNEAYVSYGGCPDGQICAAYPKGGKDACQGDSGGPLTIDGRLAGISSWGHGCARPGYPGVYTEVARYRNWIKEKIGL